MDTVLQEIVVEAPSVSGIPLKLTLNMTLLTGDKRDFEMKKEDGGNSVLAKFWPTMSIETSAGWTMSIGGTKKRAMSGLMYRSYLVSDMAFKLDTSRNGDGRIESIKLDMISPNNEMIILKKSYEVLHLEAGKLPKEMSLMDKREKMECAKSVLGFSGCYEMRRPLWAPNKLIPSSILIKQEEDKKVDEF